MGPRFNAQTWAVMTLTHQAMKECLMEPDREGAILTRLEQALTALMGGQVHVSGD